MQVPFFPAMYIRGRGRGVAQSLLPVSQFALLASVSSKQPGQGALVIYKNARRVSCQSSHLGPLERIRTAAV